MADVEECEEQPQVGPSAFLSGLRNRFHPTTAPAASTTTVTSLVTTGGSGDDAPPHSASNNSPSSSPSPDTLLDDDYDEPDAATAAPAVPHAAAAPLIDTVMGDDFDQDPLRAVPAPLPQTVLGDDVDTPPTADANANAIGDDDSNDNENDLSQSDLLSEELPADPITSDDYDTTTNAVAFVTSELDTVMNDDFDEAVPDDNDDDADDDDDNVLPDTILSDDVDEIPPSSSTITTHTTTTTTTTTSHDRQPAATQDGFVEDDKDTETTLSDAERTSLMTRRTALLTELAHINTELGVTGGGSSSDQEESTYECNVCLDEARDAVVTQCGHLFCWPCLAQWLDTQRLSCPVCKSGVTRDQVVPIYGRGRPSLSPVTPLTSARPSGTQSQEQPHPNRHILHRLHQHFFTNNNNNNNNNAHTTLFPSLISLQYGMGLPPLTETNPNAVTHVRLSRFFLAIALIVWFVLLFA